MINTIQIVALAAEEDIADFGIEEILQDFLQTMFQLAAGGIEIELAPNMNHIFHGALIGLLGDIPAVHYLIGMKEGVGNALRFCRHCWGHGQEIQELFREDQFEPRALPLHNALVDILTAMPNGPEREAFSTLVGINGASFVEAVPFFNLITMAPQDIMHTMFEGGVSHEIRLFLRYCIRDAQYFTLEELNRRIKNFPYGYQETSNKPSPIQDAHIDAAGPGLPRQKAAQLWLLARVLQFLIHDLVPAEDLHRQCWEMHLRILFAAASPEVHPGTPNALANAIEAHHLAFIARYPNVNVTPKLHFYVHLPAIQLRFGSSCLKEKNNLIQPKGKEEEEEEEEEEEKTK